MMELPGRSLGRIIQSGLLVLDCDEWYKIFEVFHIPMHKTHDMEVIQEEHYKLGNCRKGSMIWGVS